MEFILEQDYLAVVSKDQYGKMKAKADENEAKSTTTSKTETAIEIVTTAIVLGSLGYAGYKCASIIRNEAKETALRRENYDLQKELEDLKRHMGDL